ncbi:MAG: hypothetical protein KIY10_08635 [Thermoplasmata archaeon]|nr:hypothetical protein [Candidatus Sysuiplasma jiujiangense]MBX8642626.1 hypothetical protein [Candidatus Sysuiplasma jiujiangense]
MFRDLFFSNPKMKDNEWVRHMYRSFAEMEDEGERSPPLSEIFDESSHPMNGSSEFTRLSLIDLPETLDFRIGRKNGR